MMLWDLAVPLLYLSLVAGIGWRVSRSTHSDDDLFLAGRSLGWSVVGLSLFASNISSTTLIGLAGAAYNRGIAVAAYEWMAALALVFAAIVLLPLYLRNRIQTLPDYIEQRFDRRARRYVSGIMIFLSIVVDTAGSLYAGALVLQVFVPQLPLWPTLIGLGVFAGLYTSAGGLKAVMLTDAIQAVILLAGSVAITVVCFHAFDWSWLAVLEATPPDHLRMIRAASDDDLPWPGLLLGLPVMGLYYWTTNQYISQRFLAARNLSEARRGALFAAALKLLPLFIMVLPGAMAVSLFPDLERGDEVFPTLVKELLPVGLRGLVLAGLIAAIMSTIDSALNAASALTLYDLVGLEERQLSQRTRLRIARGTTLGFMLVAIGWAPVIRQFPGLFAYLQQVFAYAVPPVAVVFIGGALWSRAHHKAAWVTLLGGHLLGLTLFAWSQTGHWPLHFTIDAGLLTIASSILLAVSSWFYQQRSPAPAPKRSVLFRWEDAAANPSLPWYRDYRAGTVVVVSLVALIVWGFW